MGRDAMARGVMVYEVYVSQLDSFRTSSVVVDKARKPCDTSRNGGVKATFAHYFITVS